MNITSSLVRKGLHSCSIDCGPYNALLADYAALHRFSATKRGVDNRIWNMFASLTNQRSLSSSGMLMKSDHRAVSNVLRLPHPVTASNARLGFAGLFMDLWSMEVAEQLHRLCTALAWLDEVLDIAKGFQHLAEIACHGALTPIR